MYPPRRVFVYQVPGEPMITPVSVLTPGPASSLRGLPGDGDVVVGVGLDDPGPPEPPGPSLELPGAVVEPGWLGAALGSTGWPG